jgi:alkyldihydroxyacetonephosphate synthase
MTAAVETKWWGWGHPDKSYALPAPGAFWSFLSEKLGSLGEKPVSGSLDDLSLRRTRLSAGELRLLEGILGAEGVSVRNRDRARYSMGKSYLDLIRIRRGQVPHPTDVVVFPGAEEQVDALLKLARERDWIVVPFGGGTSVVGGVEPPEDGRSVVTVVLQRLNRILAIDADSQLAVVQCGILGPDLERGLNASGYTLGHFPQSFEFSTLGGWIATRAAGHSSTRYGKIEHLVRSLGVLTPEGVITTPEVPAAAAGADLVQMLTGSEGAYGIITRATLKLHPLPRQRAFSSFLFPSFEAGVSAARQLLQAEIEPSVLRLSDEEETAAGAVLGGMTVGLKARLGSWWIARKGLSFSSSALLVLIFESSGRRLARDRLGRELRAAREIAARNGGLFIRGGAARSWYRRRFELPYFRDLLLDRAVMIDTLETATTWRNLMSLHRAVRFRLGSAMEEQGEKGLVLSHLSHAYPDGASLYYTFLARQREGREEEQYEWVKRAATEAILAHRGALSHHHGVGRLHRPWMRPYAGELGVRLLGALKAAVDPQAVMNPETLVEEGRLEAAAGRIRGSFGPRRRSTSLRRFAEELFDLAVIGGGITGAGIACDAARRGMKVALVEKGDFAGGTSSRSSKMIHGGLRYLSQLDLKLVRESLAERQRLLALAPHLVHPTPHLIPSYKGRLEKIELKIGMLGYDLLAASRSIAPHQKLSAEEVLEREPLLKRQGLGGGFIYYDCLVNDARLTLATLKSAAEAGAVLANYVACLGLEREAGRVRGLRYRDVLGDAQGTLRAEVVVNATGPWSDAVRAMAGEKGSILRLTKGVHLVVAREKLALRHVVVFFTEDDRAIFAAPFGRFAYIGTTDTDYHGDPDQVEVKAEDVSYLLEVINEGFDGTRLEEGDVISAWAGLRPLLREEGRPSSVSRDYEILVGEADLVTIAGGKLTTYRAMAETLLDEVLERFESRFGRRFGPSRPAPLFGGDTADFQKYAAGAAKSLGAGWGVAGESLERLLGSYGTDHLRVVSLGLVHRGFLRRLAPTSDLLTAEVVYAVEEEMAMTLEDFMERRADLKHFSSQCGLEVAERVAHLMGGQLGWSETDKRREVERYRNAVLRMTEFRRQG